MELHVEIAAEELFKVGPVSVTNSMLVMFLVMIALLLFGAWVARRVTADPATGGKSGGMVEVLIEFLLGLVVSSAGQRIGRRVFPLVAGLFIFIFTANMTGLLPGMGTIYLKPDEHTEETAHQGTTTNGDEATVVAGNAVNGGEGEPGGNTDQPTVTENEASSEVAEDEEHEANTPIFRAPNADLNMTLAMATLTFVVVQIAGVSAHGVGGRIKHMANPPFIFPIEVISEFSRIISLSARLFGNVFAGEVLLTVMYGIANAIKIAVVPLLAPVVFLGLELLFGTIQALVFALLTLIYIYLAAAGHDEHGEAHAGHHDTVGEASAIPAPAAE